MTRIRVLLLVAGAALLGVVGISAAAVDGSRDVEWLEIEQGPGDGLRPLDERARVLKAERLGGSLQLKAQSPEGAKTVTVNCAKGESIQDAVDKDVGPLVVEVIGLCAENVRIERKAVTLRGADPATDGIQGVVADPPVATALAVVYSDAVRLENLSVRGGPAGGVGIWFSHAAVENCRITGNATTGLHLSSNSFLDAVELTLSENGARGLHVQRGATAFCTGCTLSDNAGFAAGAATGGLLALLDSVISGTSGLVATHESYADIDCVHAVTDHPCGLAASFRAALASTGGTVALWGVGDFSGQLLGVDRSLINLVGARQVSTGHNPAGLPVSNLLTTDAMLWTEPVEDELGVVQQSRLMGTTRVLGFSRALLTGATELDGSVLCDSAGDAWLDPAVALAPGSSVVGCEHAPPAP